MRFCILTLMFLNLCIGRSLAQSQKIDSLYRLLTTLPADTQRVNVLYELGFEIYSNNAQKTVELGLEAVEISKKSNSKAHLAKSYHMLAIGYDELKEYNRALEYINYALNIRKSIKDQKGVARSYNSLGVINKHAGNLLESLDNYLSSYFVSIDLNDSKGINRALSNINPLMPELLSSKAFSMHEKELAIKKIEKYNYPELKATIFHAFGTYETRSGSREKGIDYFKKAIHEYGLIGNKVQENYIRIDLASAYDFYGNNEMAMKEIISSISFFEKSIDHQKLGAAYFTAGNILVDLDYSSAIKYYEKAKYFYSLAGNYNGIISTYNHLAICYLNRKEYQNGFDVIDSALKIIKEKKAAGTFYAHNSLMRGDLYSEISLPDSALKYYLISADLYLKEDSPRLAGFALKDAASSLLDLNRFDEADSLCRKAIELSTSNQVLPLLTDVTLTMSKIKESQGKFQESLEFYKQYQLLSDSLSEISNDEEMTKAHLNYEHDKQSALERAEFEKKNALAKAEINRKELELIRSLQEKSILEKENQLKALNLEKAKQEMLAKDAQAISQKNQIEILNKENELKALQSKKDEEEIQSQQRMLWMVSVGGSMIFVLLVFSIRAYLQKRKDHLIIQGQKEEVEKQKKLTEYQKDMVEEKQKEILDSISYAKRLQYAILATEEEITSHFPNNFLLYKPKDIVAGDFYFFETTPTHIFYAAADCTGHGVPGAMVSIVCSNALTRCVKEFDLSDPGKILDKARELVVATFEKSGQDVKDGMDISLIAIDKSTKEIKWSGANNPLWYIENNELKEITATKQPIGKVDDPKPFVTHSVSNLSSEISSLYLFTDGYADQFGGPKGKKFKYANLSKLLQETCHLSLSQQKDLLHQEFEDWKGELEQVDDVCVIGIMI